MRIVYKTTKYTRTLNWRQSSFELVFPDHTIFYLYESRNTTSIPWHLYRPYLHMLLSVFS